MRTPDMNLTSAEKRHLRKINKALSGLFFGGRMDPVKESTTAIDLFTYTLWHITDGERREQDWRHNLPGALRGLRVRLRVHRAHPERTTAAGIRRSDGAHARIANPGGRRQFIAGWTKSDTEARE